MTVSIYFNKAQNRKISVKRHTDILCISMIESIEIKCNIIFFYYSTNVFFLNKIFLSKT